MSASQPSLRTTPARNQRRITAIALVAVLTCLCLAAILTPTSSAAYLAKITNSTNKAVTATYFTCTGAVQADSTNALFAFRLDEASGSTSAADVSPQQTPGQYQGSMTSNRTNGACPRDSPGAYVLNGTTSYLTTTWRTGINTFSLEIWFKTTNAGGRLIGFGNTQTGASVQSDRHLYMSNTGQIVFGVNPKTIKTIISPQAYNDGVWHHAIATLSTAGMKLYLDGQNVASDPTTTTAQDFNGHWRIGYDTLNGWGATQPTNFFFNGSLRFASVYPMELTPTQIFSHYNAGR